MRRRLGSSGPPLVSILTPSIAERAEMLAECERSVQAQTFERWEHLVYVDVARDGCATVMNRLADAAAGEWLLPFADDDLMLPGYLRTLLAAADAADIVYSPPLIWGRDPGLYCREPPSIPSAALIRRELWRRLGGYDHEWNREEDRRLWVRALEADARFVRTNGQPTWIYRFHTGNKSLNQGVAS